MTPPDPMRDLELLIRSRYGLIQLHSEDEGRVQGLLQHVADRMEIPYFYWSRVGGLQRPGHNTGVYGTERLETAFSHIHSSRAAALYHFHEVASELADDATQAARLKSATESLCAHEGAVVLSGSAVALPSQLERLSASVTLPGPTADDFRELISQILRDLHARSPSRSPSAPRSSAFSWATCRGSPCSRRRRSSPRRSSRTAD